MSISPIGSSDPSNTNLPVLVGIVGSVAEPWIAPYSAAREIYVTPAVVEHYRKHKYQFPTKPEEPLESGLIRAEQMLPALIAAPMMIVKDKKQNSLLFIEKWDKNHLLMVPIKMKETPAELWLQTVHVMKEKRFAKRYADAVLWRRE